MNVIVKVQQAEENKNCKKKTSSSKYPHANYRKSRRNIHCLEECCFFSVRGHYE